jgi:hypothetical protein
MIVLPSTVIEFKWAGGGETSTATLLYKWPFTNNAPSIPRNSIPKNYHRESTTSKEI